MNDELKDHSRDTLEKCERLLANADFAWFLAEAINRPMFEADGKLKDLHTSKDEREIAAHVRQALEDAAKFVQSRLNLATRRQQPSGDGING